MCGGGVSGDIVIERTRVVYHESKFFPIMIIFMCNQCMQVYRREV